MTNSSKSSLIAQNKVNDEKANQMQNPIGILSLFHSKGKSGGTQRLIMEASDVLEIYNSTSDTKDDALARIDKQIRSNVPFATNDELAVSLANYLPHTQSWNMTNLSRGGNIERVGFIINFDVDSVSICTRQVLSMDIEQWKSLSTEEQISHTSNLNGVSPQSNSSMMGNLLKATPTETILTAEQKEERSKAMQRARGMRDYYYGSECVWAINKKMADKKARKLGLV